MRVGINDRHKIVNRLDRSNGLVPMPLQIVVLPVNFPLPFRFDPTGFGKRIPVDLLGVIPLRTNLEEFNGVTHHAVAEIQLGGESGVVVVAVAESSLPSAQSVGLPGHQTE